MKKYAIIVLLTISLFVLQKASAEDNLIIPNWQIDAYLLDNGDLQITEEITFQFNTQFNGVFREVVLSNTDGIADITVQEKSGNSYSNYKAVKVAANGDRKVFQVIEDKDNVLIKIYAPSKDESRTFQVSYLLKNVAVKYNDIGELYYKFIGKENKTTIEQLSINVYLPQNTLEEVKVFAHGPSQGEILKKDNNVYQLLINKVPSKTYIEGRILFPPEWIAFSNNYQDRNMYSFILEEETVFQKKLEDAKERKESFILLLNTLTLITIIISYIVFILILNQSKRTKNNYSELEYSNIPSDCTPAIAALITRSPMGSNVILATILDLYRKGFLKISNEQESYEHIQDHNNLMIYKLKDADASLLSHEKHLFNWLFYDLGNGSFVSMNDIGSYNKHKLINFFQTWRNNVAADANIKGYYDKSKFKQGWVLVILSLLLSALGIITAANRSIFSLFGFAAAIILLTYGLVLFNRLSDFGYDQYKRWVNFIKYRRRKLSNLSQEEIINSADIASIYALGLSATKKQEFIPDYDSMDDSNSWVFWYVLFICSDSNPVSANIHKSFETIDSASYSSDSFSGGGGGGAGGGGAGGF